MSSSRKSLAELLDEIERLVLENQMKKAGILQNLNRKDEAQYYSHNAKKLARSRMN